MFWFGLGGVSFFWFLDVVVLVRMVVFVGFFIFFRNRKELILVFTVF